MGLLPDIFGERIDLGDGNHADVILDSGEADEVGESGEPTEDATDA